MDGLLFVAVLILPPSIAAGVIAYPINEWAKGEYSINRIVYASFATVLTAMVCLLAWGAIMAKLGLLEQVK